MESDLQTWSEWVQKLQQRGYSSWVAALLEGAGPLVTVAAQAIYLTQPVLRGIVPDYQLDAMAHLFEDPQQTRKFAARLKEEHES